MAKDAEKKRRRGRRAYLNDFKVGADGEYSYRGAAYRYAGELPYNKAKLRAGVLAGTAAAATAAAGFLRAPSMMGSNFYVVPVYIPQLIAVFITAWAAVRLLANGSSLREYVHKATVRRIPGAAMAAFICALLSIAANAVYLALNGFSEKPAASAVLLCLHALAAAASFLLKKHVEKLPWERRFEEAEAFADAFGAEDGADNK